MKSCALLLAVLVLAASQVCVCFSIGGARVGRSICMTCRPFSHDEPRLWLQATRFVFWIAVPWYVYRGYILAHVALVAVFEVFSLLWFDPPTHPSQQHLERHP